MPLWFEILVLLFLALIVVQLYGIEGNIHQIAEAINDMKEAAFPNSQSGWIRRP